jgi:hypothetical protein
VPEDTTVDWKRAGGGGGGGGGLEILSRGYVDTLPAFGIVQQADERLEIPVFILHESVPNCVVFRLMSTY